LKRLKTQVIVNPESAKGRTGERWGHIREGIRHFFQEFHYEFTEKPLHATELTRAAIKDGKELANRSWRRRDDERDRLVFMKIKKSFVSKRSRIMER
jgi:hypothetical protein